MARTKVQIPVGELQSAIDQLEASGRLFTSPHKLYEAVAGTPWARALGATPVMVYLRVKEVNVDPANPVITMKVKPARRVGPRDPNAPQTRRGKAGVTFDGIDTLMDMFRGRGIEVTNVEQLLASSTRSDDENRAINLAWSDLRAKLGIPKQAKKAAPIVNDGEVLPITASPIAEEPIAAEPVIESPIAVESMIESPIAAESIVESVDPVIAVTEEMPDGGPVPAEPQAEVESEVAPDVIPFEPAVPVVAPMSVAPVVVSMPLAAPSPIQITTVRPVPSRPVPVRSSQPPRPQPIKLMYGETRNPEPWSGEMFS